MAANVDALKVVNTFETLCQQALVSGESADFARVVAEAEQALGLESRRDVAALLRVSPASVTRYAQGKNAPHPLMREAFCKLLIGEARARADVVTSQMRAQRVAEQGAEGRTASRQGSRRTPLAVPALAFGMRAAGRRED